MLLARFLRSLQKFPTRPALDFGSNQYSYENLSALAAEVAAAILSNFREDAPFVGILAQRSLVAYAGILGALSAGKAFVPLNPKFPAAQTLKRLAMGEASVLIVGKEALDVLPEILEAQKNPITLIGFEDFAEIKNLFPQHRWVQLKALADSPKKLEMPKAPPDSTAYVVFTSGSTGAPKAIATSHLNIEAYLSNVLGLYHFDEQDRFSNVFDLSFDPSIHDMFICWSVGACLCPVPTEILPRISDFIRQQGLTVWFSVPSVVRLASKLGTMKCNAMPSLKHSFFCGEAFAVDLIQLWQQAAPNSKVINFYGPTEGTVIISAYTWDPQSSIAESKNGIVPIGEIFKDQEFYIQNEAGKKCNTDEVGELYISGSQVITKYFFNEESLDSGVSSAAFVLLPNQANKIWYRTGDRVWEDKNHCLHYLGRMDQQIKIRGFRAELSEIESTVRLISGISTVVAVPWPSGINAAEGLHCFLETASLDTKEKERILMECRKQLIDILVPKDLWPLAEIPLNANGKIDRNQLAEILNLSKQSKPVTP